MSQQSKNNPDSVPVDKDARAFSNEQMAIIEKMKLEADQEQVVCPYCSEQIVDDTFCKNCGVLKIYV